MRRTNKTLVFLAAMAACMQGVFAQNGIIREIRDDYKNAKTAIAQQKEEPNMRRDIVLSTTQNVPGIGPQTYTYHLYLSGESETQVFFATVSYNIAATEFTEEYLFNVNGDLQFAYMSSYGCNDIKFHEYRLYYDVRNSSVVKVLEKVKDDSGAYRQVYDGDFKDTYKPQTATVKDRIETIAGIFETTRKTFETKGY